VLKQVLRRDGSGKGGTVREPRGETGEPRRAV